jgi:uncharacterized membrane protein YgcG
MSEEKPSTALTADESAAVDKSSSPSVGATVLGTAGAALLIGAGVGLGIGAAMPTPQQQDYAVSATGALAPSTQLATEVHDPDGVLSADDEARLLRDAERLETPAVVTQLHYMVFAENHENVNDTVEEFIRDTRPELIGADDDSFADGVLIVGVGLDPRQSFVFAGDDVADALQLRDGRHLDDAVTAIQPGVRDDNIPAGLFAGADSATDVDALSQALYDDAVGSRTASIIGGGVGAGALGGSLAAAGGATARTRSRKIAQARAEMDLVSAEYGQLAGRLDQIDVRAHSLSSPFADATMRRQWEEVRDRFLRLHDEVDTLGELTASSPDKEFLAKTDEITGAALTTRQVSYAEDNIDTLFRLEHGDDAARRTELEALRSDVVEAQVSIEDTDSGLYRELQRVRDQADSLSSRTGDEDFLDHFVVLLADYRAVLGELRRQEFGDVDEQKATALEAPAVYERGWRPGYGYHDFVPFWVMASWHTSNVQAQQAASSGATNTSFSSGFSGAGGSSSF